MRPLLPVEIHRIVIIPRVTYQPHPLRPARWYVGTLILIEVLAEVPCPIAGVRQVRGEVVDLERLLPVETRAVDVVGVDVVVVHVHARQHRAATGAAHGRRDEGVVEVRALVLQQAQRLRHVVHRACGSNDDISIGTPVQAHERQCKFTSVSASSRASVIPSRSPISIHVILVANNSQCKFTPITRDRQ